MLGGIGACAVAGAPNPRKATKAEAHYQSQPKDIRSCGTCSYFNAPKGCSVMDGDVSRDGYCDLYSMID